MDLTRFPDFSHYTAREKETIVRLMMSNMRCTCGAQKNGRWQRTPRSSKTRTSGSVSGSGRSNVRRRSSMELVVWTFLIFFFFLAISLAYIVFRWNINMKYARCLFDL